MTLCLISRELRPDAASGIASATRDLATGLAGAGHRVHVVTRAEDAPDHGPPGVRLHTAIAPAPPELPGLRRDGALEQLVHAAAIQRRVAELHRSEGPLDAVLAPLWCCEGTICALDPRYPTVISCMTSLTTLRELHPAWAQRPDVDERIALERATLRRARYVHALTQAALDDTRRQYELTPAFAEVLARAVRDRAAEPEPEPEPEPAAAGKPVQLLFVGRLEHRKGVDVLLEAMRRLVAERVDARLTLVGVDVMPANGGEPYRQAFEREHGDLGGRVRFRGYVEQAELDALYRTADVVCVPSRYESHGIVATEAMMHGRAIVASDVGGLGEVLGAGRALLARPGDVEGLVARLRAAIADPSLRRELGRRGREHYEREHTTDVVAARTASLLARAAATHRRQQPQPPAESQLTPAVAELVSEVLSLERETALAVANELLAPPPARWESRARVGERERRAWQRRAMTAERERAVQQQRVEHAEQRLSVVLGSRSWRATAPLRRLGARLRRLGR